MGIHADQSPQSSQVHDSLHARVRVFSSPHIAQLSFSTRISPTSHSPASVQDHSPQVQSARQVRAFTPQCSQASPSCRSSGVHTPSFTHSDGLAHWPSPEHVCSLSPQRPQSRIRRVPGEHSLAAGAGSLGRPLPASADVMGRGLPASVDALPPSRNRSVRSVSPSPPALSSFDVGLWSSIAVDRLGQPASLGEPSGGQVPVEAP